jgi:phosphatidylserine/phosphatidylglycerophosphate/cardiolipin synthase-like enzyme
MSVFHLLSRPVLQNLSGALSSGRLGTPFPIDSIVHYVPVEQCEAVQKQLTELYASSMTNTHISILLSMLCEERKRSQNIADRLDLVWSGEGVDFGEMCQHTATVVQRLFEEAQHSILIATYAIDIGDRAKHLFGKLAQRMDEDSTLEVQLFINIPRKFKDETPSATLLREFAEKFRNNIWPGKRYPEVFHDPRSLEIGEGTRACLHAKCIIVDNEKALISSANFTEAAQERNIEAGILVDDKQIAMALRTQFKTLVERGKLSLLAVS